MKYTKEDMIEMLDGYNKEFHLIKLEDSITGHSRWSVLHSVIFQDKELNKFFKANYRVGATEMQDESPFQYEDEVEVEEVKQVEKTVLVWEKI